MYFRSLTHLSIPACQPLSDLDDADLYSLRCWGSSLLSPWWRRKVRIRRSDLSTSNVGLISQRSYSTGFGRSMTPETQVPVPTTTRMQRNRSTPHLQIARIDPRNCVKEAPGWSSETTLSPCGNPLCRTCGSRLPLGLLLQIAIGHRFAAVEVPEYLTCTPPVSWSTHQMSPGARGTQLSPGKWEASTW